MSIDLAVIEAALKAATNYPWKVTDLRNAPDGNRDCIWVDADPGNEGSRTYRTVAEMTEDEGLQIVWSLSDAHLIANAPAWLAELVERVKAAEAEVERLREAVQDFADYGTRHDTTPTISAEPDVLWWYGYIQSMDRGVRERGRRALNHTGGVTPEPATSGQRNRFTSANSREVDETTPRARAEDATEPILRPTDQRYEPPADRSGL